VEDKFCFHLIKIKYEFFYADVILKGIMCCSYLFHIVKKLQSFVSEEMFLIHYFVASMGSVAKFVMPLHIRCFH